MTEAEPFQIFRNKHQYVTLSPALQRDKLREGSMALKLRTLTMLCCRGFFVSDNHEIREAILQRSIAKPSRRDFGFLGDAFGKSGARRFPTGL